MQAKTLANPAAVAQKAALSRRGCSVRFQQIQNFLLLKCRTVAQFTRLHACEPAWKHFLGESGWQWRPTVFHAEYSKQVSPETKKDVTKRGNGGTLRTVEAANMYRVLRRVHIAAFYDVVKSIMATIFSLTSKEKDSAVGSFLVPPETKKGVIKKILHLAKAYASGKDMYAFHA